MPPTQVTVPSDSPPPLEASLPLDELPRSGQQSSNIEDLLSREAASYLATVRTTLARAAPFFVHSRGPSAREVIADAHGAGMRVLGALTLAGTEVRGGQKCYARLRVSLMLPTAYAARCSSPLPHRRRSGVAVSGSEQRRTVSRRARLLRHCAGNTRDAQKGRVLRRRLARQLARDTPTRHGARARSPVG